MPDIPGGFNAEEIEPSVPFEILPPARYTVIVSASEVKDAKSGNGQYVKLEYTIVDGEHANRKVWSQHNIVHNTPKAEQIGREQFSAVCHAVGVLRPKATEDLHDKPLVIEVGIEKGDDKYPDKNVVKAWLKSDATPPAVPPKAAAAAAPKRAPWQTKAA